MENLVKKYMRISKFLVEVQNKLEVFIPKTPSQVFPRVLNTSAEQIYCRIAPDGYMCYSTGMQYIKEKTFKIPFRE